MSGFLPDWNDIEDPEDPKFYEYLKNNLPKSTPGSGFLSGLENLQLAQPTGQVQRPAQPTLVAGQNLRSPQSMAGPPPFNPAAISRVIPGRTATVPTSSVVQKEVPLQEEINSINRSKELLKEQFAAQADVLDSQADWEIKKSEVLDRVTKYEEAYAAKQSLLDQEKLGAVQNEMAKLKMFVDEAQAGQIEDYWANKSTGKRILAGIAVGIGTAAQIMGGGQNAAAQHIENAIEADLQKQRMNLQSKYTAVEAQKGILSQTEKIYDDREESMNAARIASIRGVAAELNAMEARAASDTTRQNIAVLRNELEQKANAIEQQFFQSMRSKVTQQFATKSTPTQVITQGQEAGWIDYREKVKSKETDKFVSAYGGFARSKKEAIELRDAASKREQLKGMLRQLIEFRENNDQFTPENRARAKAIWRNAQLLEKGPSFAQLGVIAGADMDILNSVMEDPNAIFKFSVPSYKATLDTVRAAEQADVVNKIEPAYNIPEYYKKQMTIYRPNDPAQKMVKDYTPGM